VADIFFPLDYWAYGLSSYLFFHILHILVWRGRALKGDVRLLFVLLIGIPEVVYLNLLLKWGGVWVAPGIVHGLLAANYIAIYPAFQASSPTISILAFLWREKRTIPETDLVKLFATEDVMGNRMEDLATSGLVKKEDEKLSLSSKGRLLATFFIFYRKALGLPRGVG
jgi:hypothetical protein